MPVVTFSLEEDLLDRAKAHAERERRSLSAQVAYWVEQELREQDLTKTTEDASGDAAQPA